MRSAVNGPASPESLRTASSRWSSTACSGWGLASSRHADSAAYYLSAGEAVAARSGLVQFVLHGPCAVGGQKQVLLGFLGHCGWCQDDQGQGDCDHRLELAQAVIPSGEHVVPSCRHRAVGRSAFDAVRGAAWERRRRLERILTDVCPAAVRAPVKNARSWRAPVPSVYAVGGSGTWPMRPPAPRSFVSVQDRDSARPGRAVPALASLPDDRSGRCQRQYALQARAADAGTP